MSRVIPSSAIFFSFLTRQNLLQYCRDRFQKKNLALVLATKALRDKFVFLPFQFLLPKQRPRKPESGINGLFTKKDNYTAPADLKIDFINNRTPNCNLVRVFSFLPPPFWKTRGLWGWGRASRVQSFPHASHLRVFLRNQPNYPLRKYPLWCLFMKISVYDRLYVDVRFLRNLGVLVCTYSTFKINISQVLFA